MTTTHKLPIRVLVYAKHRMARGYARAAMAREILREMRILQERKPTLPMPLLNEPECEQFFIVYDALEPTAIDTQIREEAAARERARREAMNARRRAYFRELRRAQRANPAYRDYENANRRKRRETLKQSPEAFAVFQAKERTRVQRWRAANPELYRAQNARQQAQRRAKLQADPAAAAAFREKERIRARAYRARKRKEHP